MARSIALLVAVAGALLWAYMSVLPPAPLGGDAPSSVFSAARAFTDVEAISRLPHPVGSAENARVRTYLEHRLTALGAEVSDLAVPLSQKSIRRLIKWRGPIASGAIGHDIIGIIRGRDATLPAVLMMAHHDSVEGSPGAADDAAGVASALEAARAIKATGQPLRDVIVLFTDSEEIGLDGSAAFFGSHPLAHRIGVIVNMDARGGAGRANMFETGANNGIYMRAYRDVVKRPAANSLSVLLYDLLPNSTDYTMAKQLGIPGYNLAFLGGAWAYHSPLATPAALDRGSLQDMGDQLLALTHRFAFAAELPAAAPNAAFADVLGRTMILYSTPIGWLVLAAAGLLIGLAFWRTRPSPSAVGGGAIVAIALLAHAALFLTAFNAISGSGHADYYDRLAALPRLELAAALIVAALIAIVPNARRRELRLTAIGPALAMMWGGLIFGGPLVLTVASAVVAGLAGWCLPRKARGSGALLLLLLAATGVQIAMPTAAPLLAWPLLLAAIGMAARAWLPPLPATILTIMVAVVGLGHLLGQAHMIFLGIGAELPIAMLAILLPALPLLWPLLPDRTPWWIAGAALLAALTITLWVRLDPIAPSVATYSAAEHGRKTKD